MEKEGVTSLDRREGWERTRADKRNTFRADPEREQWIRWAAQKRKAERWT